MSKVQGVKSVDFKITARGYGVVNWNGPTALAQPDGTELKNHSLPKLRGFSNLSNRTKKKDDGKEYIYKKAPNEINFKETPMYISQNCIRHHLFKDNTYDVHFSSGKDGIKLLTSMLGLVRGYAIPSTQCKRNSPLLIEDFVDTLNNGNFEQLSSSSSIVEVSLPNGEKTYKRGENSIFSKTTFGDTKYTAYGSISIELLEFISLDKKFDRAAMIIKEGEGEKVAQVVQDFIQNLDPSRNPKATFHTNYVRQGTIYKEGENGILLDEVAVDIVIQETIKMLSELSIRQAKGYMYVDELEVDYNDSHKMMRIKHSSREANPGKTAPYAVYFYAK